MDELDKLREALATVIAAAQAFPGTAGSPEMRGVQNAIEYMGYAYSCLRDRDDVNPAWSS